MPGEKKDEKLAEMRTILRSGSADDEQIKASQKVLLPPSLWLWLASETWYLWQKHLEDYKYLHCPHTAVGHHHMPALWLPLL